MSCSQNSAYQTAAAGCFPDGVPKKQPMTPQCHQTLVNMVHFDSSFEQDSSGTQKERIIQAIYLLLTYPLRFPLEEKKVFGIAPAGEFISPDLQRLYNQSPEKNVNQVFFDYAFDAIRIFKLTTDSEANYNAWYNPFDRSVTIKSKSVGTFSRILSDAGIVTHEMRHSEFLDHEIYCPQLAPSNNACDKGTNRSNGWEASFYWAFLQGNEIDPLTPLELQTAASLLLDRTQYIYLMPDSWNELQGPVYNPFSYKNLPTMQDVISKEQLTYHERDYYSEVIKDCVPNFSTRPDACLQKLGSLLSFTQNPLQSILDSNKQILLLALRNLVVYPVQSPSTKTILGVASSNDLLSGDLAELLATHPHQLINQVLFNYILSAIQEFMIGAPSPNSVSYDFPTRRFYVPSTFDPQNPIDSWTLTMQLIQAARASEIWPRQHLCKDPELYCEPGTQGGHGWAAFYLWALLGGSNNDLFTDYQLGYFKNQLCQQFEAMAQLPASLKAVQTLSCDALY